MLLFIHGIAGMVIGTYFHSFILIVLVSLILHFVMDVIPHWDGPFDKKHFKESNRVKYNGILVYIQGVSLIWTILLIYFLYIEVNNKFLLFGAFFSVLPDFMKLGYFTKLKNKKYYKNYLHFHNNIQRETGFILGMLTQILVLIILLKLLI